VFFLPAGSYKLAVTQRRLIICDINSTRWSWNSAVHHRRRPEGHPDTWSEYPGTVPQRLPAEVTSRRRCRRTRRPRYGRWRRCRRQWTPPRRWSWSTGPADVLEEAGAWPRRRRPDVRSVPAAPRVCWTLSSRSARIHACTLLSAFSPASWIDVLPRP